MAVDPDEERYWANYTAWEKSRDKRLVDERAERLKRQRDEYVVSDEERIG